MNKKISRRRFIISGAGAGAAFIAAAASGIQAPVLHAQSPTATPAPTNTPIPLPEGSAGKLTVIHRTEYFVDVQNIFRDTVTNYATNKGVELDISTANPEQFGDFTAKMQAAVQAGNPPDLGYHTIQITQLHALDLVEDVTDVVEKAISLYGDVVPKTAADNAFFDGKWWAVPFISITGAWFARKDVFEAKGIDVNTLDTWDKRRDAALAVSDPDNKMWGWGITINQSGDGFGFLVGVIQAFGGSFTDETGLKVTFNSPETIAAANWLKETYSSEKYKPMLPPGIESWTDSSNNEAYLAGTVALTLNQPSVYAKAKADKNPVFENTAILHGPKTLDGRLLESGNSGWLTIFKGSKNVDVAKDLIYTLLDPTNSVAMAKVGGGLVFPAYKNLWTDDLIKADPNFETIREIQFNPDVYYGTSHPAKPNALIAAIQSASIPNQMMANIINSGMSVEDAVKDAHDRIVQIFEEGGAPQ